MNNSELSLHPCESADLCLRGIENPVRMTRGMKDEKIFDIIPVGRGTTDWNERLLHINMLWSSLIRRPFILLNIMVASAEKNREAKALSN